MKSAYEQQQEQQRLEAQRAEERRQIQMRQEALQAQRERVLKEREQRLKEEQERELQHHREADRREQLMREEHQRSVYAPHSGFSFVLCSAESKVSDHHKDVTQSTMFYHMARFRSQRYCFEKCFRLLFIKAGSHSKRGN